MDLIKSNKLAYIDHVKNLLPYLDSRREIIQTECILMKSFYQTKGTIILTSEELIFVYIDEESTEDDVKIQDNLFFFKKNKSYQKIFKKIDLEGIKDIQRRRFIG
jgi:hypothetical protein